jgi:hypothetical protein
MWLKDETEVKKAKKADKKAYGHEGFDSRDGYVPYQTCIDFIKLVKSGATAGALATQFELGLNDMLTIITYWTQYIKAEDDFTDIKCFGGKEYSEILKLKKKPAISQDDIHDTLMDIHLFEKGKGDTK